MLGIIAQEHSVDPQRRITPMPSIGATGPKPSSNHDSSRSYDAGQAFRHAMRPEVLVGARRENEEMDRQIDRLRDELPFFRAFQVTTLLFLAAVVFGGFGQ